jgi:hypothetical protein
MSLWSRMKGWFGAQPSPRAAAEPAQGRGVGDVLSIDLGDRTAWTQRGMKWSRWYAIYTAICTDATFLRASFLVEQLARQGGITLKPASGPNVSDRKAALALAEVEAFLAGVQNPFEEGWQDQFFLSVAELGRWSNFAMERIYQGGRLANLDLLPWISMNETVDPLGRPSGWVQFDYFMHRIPFELEEVLHGRIHRIPGDRYGSPLMEPASVENGDLQAYRGIEALSGEQAQHCTFPDRIINFGTESFPETSDVRMLANKDTVEDMVRHGVIVGGGRVSGQSLTPQGMDLSPYLSYWQKRAAISTGFSLARFGIVEDISQATVEVLDAQESMTLRSLTLSAASTWKHGVFVPVLEGLGYSADLAPSLVPGEVNPVRREKHGIYVADLYGKGIVTLNEARTANGYPEMTDDQQDELEPPEPSTPAPTPEPEPPDRQEDREEDRSR